MSNLSQQEIEKLFSGAPQFFARSLGHNTGAPNPSVAFPWDEDLGIRDLTDHVQIENEAWGSMTTRPKLIMRDPLSPVSATSRTRPHFDIRCMERPNMLSMQGLERGTMGYQAALEMSVADTQLEEQYGFDSMGTKGRVIVEQRQRLITSKDGLRHLDDATIMEQLLKTEERYHGDRHSQQSHPEELYNELFAKILLPPTRVMDRKDPQGLPTQISALVKVLATHNAWVDFSRVEWRLRLGQILWGFPLDDELTDGIAINEGNGARERAEERYWLLLQILLACELLVRLDAITEGDEMGAKNLRSTEIQKFEREANPSVKWSLLLARCWLENISITKNTPCPQETSITRGWLTALSNKIHLRHDHMYGNHHTDNTQHLHNLQAEHIYGIRGRYLDRQFFGLTQFARKLRWPDVDAYELKMTWHSSALNDTTPINTPLATSYSRKTSYFEGQRASIDTRRQQPRRRRVEAALHEHGWLSKSYVSGLVLPGEGLPHFLMSTLLENDEEALATLGPRAALSGGLVYKGKSFWSTASVVGRVLAAGYGAAESMGWVSSDVVPQAFGDGWVVAEVSDIPEDLKKTGKTARIWGKTLVEKDSDVLGDGDPSNVLPADFVIPHENNYETAPPGSIRIELKSFDFFRPNKGLHSSADIDVKMTNSTDLNNETEEIPTYPASMAFNMTHDGEEHPQELNYALSKDVYFVTAHPCRPSSRVRLFKSPTSPTIRQIDVGGKALNGQSSPESITGHPLHKRYKYTAVHLLDLLQRPDVTMEELFRSSTPVDGPGSSAKENASRVLVIDCITGFAPPRSPDLGSDGLSRVSSLSSSFGLEPAVPQLQPAPNTQNGSNGSRSSNGANGANGSPEPNHRPGTSGTAGSVGSRYSRIDPPDSCSRFGSRKRRYGSDLEMLVRALCAEKGWNALISRRRKNCLACSIREAGALGWKVVIRVD